MRKMSFILALVLVFSISSTQISLGGFGSLTRMLGLVAFCIWFLTILRHPLRRPHAYHKYAVLFFCYSVISLGWTQNVDYAIDNLLRYFQSIGVTFLLWDLARSRIEVSSVLKAYVLGCFVSILVIYWNYFHGNMFDIGRYSSVGFNPNDIALQLVMAMPIAWHIFTSGNTAVGFLRHLFFVYPILAIVAVILTGSRGAFVASVPVAFYFLVSFRTYRISMSYRLLFAFLLMVMGAYTSNLDIAANLERFVNIPVAAESDRFAGRLDIWAGGIKVFQESPWLGVGPGNFGLQAFQYSGMQDVAHNLYLSILCEGGIIGFAVFVSILAVVIREIFKFPPKERAVWAAVFSCWAIGVFSSSWQYVPQTWLLFLFVIMHGSKVGIVLKDAMYGK